MCAFGRGSKRPTRPRSTSGRYGTRGALELGGAHADAARQVTTVTIAVAVVAGAPVTDAHRTGSLIYVACCDTHPSPAPRRTDHPARETRVTFGPWSHNPALSGQNARRVSRYGVMRRST